ncbi:hypothetical protein C8Q80DRAFT_470644 [Daedaleopsis nitida]|nr:hypothetical protein C8Q80DRAFT_470644 [Daedaleopsis nitida]
MYKLIRRISSSFFPRPDRPWSEDATSTAPQIGRKRRLSSTEPDEDRESTPAKKHRAESESVQGPGEEPREPTPSQPAKETEEVKEVTKGVQEVELEDGQPKPPAEKSQDESETTEMVPEAETAAEKAAAVPLPDSPQLKAADDDLDAEGEEDVEEKERDDATDATAVDDVSSSGKEDEPVSVAEEDEEVPGLTLPSASPKKSTKAKTRSATKQTAVAS